MYPYLEFVLKECNSPRIAPFLTRHFVSLLWVLVSNGWPTFTPPDLLWENGLSHTEIRSSTGLPQVIQASYDLSLASLCIIFQGFEFLESEVRVDRCVRKESRHGEKVAGHPSQHWCIHKTLPVL